MVEGRIALKRKIIRSVAPEEDHVLRVEFDTGSVLLLSLSGHLDSLRLRPLRSVSC